MREDSLHFWGILRWSGVSCVPAFFTYFRLSHHSLCWLCPHLDADKALNEDITLSDEMMIRTKPRVFEVQQGPTQGCST